MSTSRSAVLTSLVLLAAFAALTATLVAARNLLNLAAVALLYLLFVFALALRWGRGLSMIAGLLAFFALNYFFTMPYYTFVVSSPRDVVSLLVFLLVAVTTSRLVAQLRARETEALERLALQRQAAEAEVLRRSDELKSALLSAVSHDLRTPLSAIRTAASGLLQQDLQWVPSTRREMLELIDAESDRLSRLVENLLNLSRIEAGALHPTKEWRHLEEVAALAVEHYRYQLRDHQITLTFPRDLPPVEVDFALIEDVFVNLLDNAVRHAPEGSEVVVRARAEGDTVVVVVENSGPSVPFDAAEEIFSRFHSAAAGRHAGLGLAICKGLIEAHGGRVWVDRPGEPGARFAFALPIAPRRAET